MHNNKTERKSLKLVECPFIFGKKIVTVLRLGQWPAKKCIVGVGSHARSSGIFQHKKLKSALPSKVEVLHDHCQELVVEASKSKTDLI